MIPVVEPLERKESAMASSTGGLRKKETRGHQSALTRFSVHTPNGHIVNAAKAFSKS